MEARYEIHNAYSGDYRACHINGLWRLLRRNPDKASRMQWLFVNDIEYHSAWEALTAVDEPYPDEDLSDRQHLGQFMDQD